MPSYKGHLLGSFCAYTITIFIFSLCYLPLSYHAEWLLCTILGGLFPDIDIKSKGQKIFYRILFVMVCFVIAQKKFYILALLALFSCVPLMVKHRGLTHNITFVVAVLGSIIIGTALFSPHLVDAVIKDAFFFLVGAISHIWLDFGFKKMMR
ncbi:MAG: metal-dependent hydrolase [Candidatus Babeliaceae bacterium]|jgi:hypothetical protein